MIVDNIGLEFKRIKNQLIESRLKFDESKKELDEIETKFIEFMSNSFKNLIGAKIEIRYTPSEKHSAYVIIEGKVFGCGPGKYVILRHKTQNRFIYFEEISSWQVLED